VSSLPGLLVSTALIGGLLGVERTAFGQFSLSRPLAASFLFGILTGQPAEGAMVGILFELLFIRAIPAGSYVPYHPLYPALLAVMLLASGVLGDHGWMRVPAAALFALPAILPDRLAEIVWRRSNERAITRSVALFRMGNPRQARTVHLLSISRAFLFHALSIALSGAILYFFSSWILAAIPGALGYFAIIGITPFFVGLAGVSANRLRGLGWIGFVLGLLAGALVGSGVLA